MADSFTKDCPVDDLSRRLVMPASGSAAPIQTVGLSLRARPNSAKPVESVLWMSKFHSRTASAIAKVTNLSADMRRENHRQDLQTRWRSCLDPGEV